MTFAVKSVEFAMIRTTERENLAKAIPVTSLYRYCACWCFSLDPPRCFICSWICFSPGIDPNGILFYRDMNKL